MLIRTFILIALILFFLNQPNLAQSISIDTVEAPASIKVNRERGLNMLDEIKYLIKERYYDKNYRNINLEDKFKTAAERIKKLNYNWQIFRVIAQVVLDFNDSHTRFYPPSRANQVEYGFTMQIIGNKCFVVDVKKGSDAEAKGLKVGDIIIGIGNFATSRENLWKIEYLLYELDPQEKLKLFISDSDLKRREIEIQATFKSIKEREKEAEKRRKEKRENPYKCQVINAEIIACKLYTFSVDKKYVDKMMREVGTYKNLILDLRGNGGGYVSTEEHLTGYFFDRNVKIATFVTRDKTKERTAKSQKEKAYKGELVVLIDSNSASASEVFARVIQLEKRGKIVGDVSAGAVMTSNFITMANSRGVPGFETLSLFAMNITVADLIMSDGNRLENIGVMPDYPIGPTGKALLNKTDPILAYAAEMFGAKITDEDAGKFYFLTKKVENEEAEENSGGNDN